MVAALLLLLWRQVPSVCELARLLGREDLFWAPKITVSQQALSQRFLVFPAEIMQRVLLGVAAQGSPLGYVAAALARIGGVCAENL